MERYCIDRFEGSLAICEDESRKMLELDRASLYEGAREGDWFELVEGRAAFLKKLTLEKRNANLRLLNELME